MRIYIKKITLYTLNMYHVCESYLKKAGKSYLKRKHKLQNNWL